MRCLFPGYRQPGRGHRPWLSTGIRRVVYLQAAALAVVALLANALGWLSHRQWYRSLLGMVGPAIVLAAMLLFFGNWWTANLLYVGLALMIGVSIWDLLSPANRRWNYHPNTANALAVAETKRNDAMYLNITGMTCDSCATHVKDAWRKCRACCRRSCPTERLRATRHRPARQMR
jgi:hypothetical protein